MPWKKGNRILSKGGGKAEHLGWFGNRNRTEKQTGKSETGLYEKCSLAIEEKHP